jgi:hypothetical protein
MADPPSETRIRLLIINPNTSEHMTDALKPLVQNLGYNKVSRTTPSANYFLQLEAHKLTAVCVLGLLYILHLPQARHPVDKLPRRRGGIRRAQPPPSHPSPTQPRRFSCRMLFPASTRSDPQVRMRQARCRSHREWTGHT